MREQQIRRAILFAVSETIGTVSFATIYAFIAARLNEKLGSALKAEVFKIVVDFERRGVIKGTLDEKVNEKRYEVA